MGMFLAVSVAFLAGLMGGFILTAVMADSKRREERFCELQRRREEQQFLHDPSLEELERIGRL